MEKCITQKLEELANTIEKSYSRYTESTGTELNNQQIEDVFGFRCTKEKPNDIKDIFDNLEFDSPIKNVFEAIYTREYMTKSMPPRLVQVEPKKDTINEFITYLKDDIRLQMLDKSINYLCNFYGKYDDVRNSLLLAELRNKLFFKNINELLEAFFVVMDDNMLAEGIDKDELRNYFRLYEDILIWKLPKTTFLWGCYAINRGYEKILESTDGRIIYDSSLKLKSMAKVDTPNNLRSDDLLVNEYRFFKDFMSKLYGVAQNEIGKGAEILSNMNKSLTLKLFNDYTNLLDVYLFSKQLDPANGIKKPRKKAKKSGVSQLYKITDFIVSSDSRKGKMPGKIRQRVDMGIISSLSILKCNNVKLHLLNSEIDGMFETLDSSPHFYVLFDLVLPYLQMYIENIIKDSGLCYKDSPGYEEVSKHIWIYNSLKDAESFVSSVEPVGAALPNFNELDETAYFLTYKNTFPYINKVK